jgi:hypothetical protein
VDLLGGVQQLIVRPVRHSRAKRLLPKKKNTAGSPSRVCKTRRDSNLRKYARRDSTPPPPPCEQSVAPGVNRALVMSKTYLIRRQTSAI